MSSENIKKAVTNSEKRKEIFWKKPVVWFSATFLCVFLWGSVFPIVKKGYELFGIDNQSANVIPSSLLFAGLRFTLGGLIILGFTALTEKINPFPTKPKQIRDAFLLCIPHTLFQHGPLFIGLAYTSGAIGSILSSTSAFMAVILASIIYEDQKMNALKILGCIIGFIGIVVIDFPSPDSLGFNWMGDGMMLLSAFSSSVGDVVTKPLTKENHPRLLSGWNFIIGGSIFLIIGGVLNGKLMSQTNFAWLVVLYLGILSSIAFSLWITLLKYHQVAKISIFKSMVPVIGAVGSAILLKENIFQPRIIITIILIVLGIILVNYQKNKDENDKKSEAES
ncbi:MAG: DMT family transporter [Clostridiaceae bacterium]|nr:DMT family transporter [Clostridiaceae bacterium]